jgi:methylated-DNA-protein-cysteine methyltransferase related protein
MQTRNAPETPEPRGAPDAPDMPDAPGAPFREAVYAAVRSVPPGRVASYGAIAAAAGRPRAARAVGRALRELEDGRDDVPWWRVLNAAGSVSIRGAFHDASVQRALLEAEGVHFGASGRVDWRRHAWAGVSPAATNPVRRSVSVAITRDGGAATLLVRRPPDDADLPDAWGLPAASLRPVESDVACVRRAGLEKLGVELDVGAALRRGSVERAGYRLDMTLFAATIRRGEPSVPQPHAGVTQYAAWRWGDTPDLVPAAERGSLCCRLFLEHAASAEA